MTDPARRARRPLVTSSLVLRTLATAITLGSFSGMTIFASQNLYTSNAPLQPAAVAVAVATATPAPTTAPRTVTTSRTTVRSSVASTSTAAITRTKQS